MLDRYRAKEARYIKRIGQCNYSNEIKVGIINIAIESKTKLVGVLSQDVDNFEKARKLFIDIQVLIELKKDLIFE